MTFERRSEEEDELTGEAAVEDEETYKDVKKAFDLGSKAMGPGVGQGAKKTLAPWFESRSSSGGKGGREGGGKGGKGGKGAGGGKDAGKTKGRLPMAAKVDKLKADLATKASDLRS